MPDSFVMVIEALPPTDNYLSTPMGRRKIATRAYRTWLDAHATLLSVKLREQGFREPDAAHWWDIGLAITLTPRHRSDATNYLKASLDLLGGAQIVNGRVVHMGGLYANDRRVRRCVIEWAAVEKTPRLVVHAAVCDGPRGLDPLREEG